MNQFKKILVFTTNWLGDALFLSPFIACLRDNFPKSHIVVLTVPRVEEIFKNNPHVDKIINFYEKAKMLGFFSRLGLIFRLRKEGFDTAFILKPSLSRTLLLKCAGIKKIIGFDNKKSGWLLTVKVPTPSVTLHKVDYFLAILEYLGLKISKRRYEFFSSLEDKAYIDRLFLEKKINPNLPLIIINPGANWFPKRWLPDNFAGLIQRVEERIPTNIVITGAEKDKNLAREIIDKSRKKVFDLTGQTTLGQLGALIERASVVVSADSGPMHIAAAVGARLIALFGPTAHQITGPYLAGEHIIIQRDVGCKVPCYEKNCRDYRCMKAITVEEVFKKVTELLTH